MTAVVLGLLLCSLVASIPILQETPTLPCRYDYDGDGVCDEADNCPFTANSDQTDICTLTYISAVSSTVISNSSLDSAWETYVCSNFAANLPSGCAGAVSADQETLGSSLYRFRFFVAKPVNISLLLNISAALNNLYPNFPGGAFTVSSVYSVFIDKDSPSVNENKPGSTISPDISMPCLRYIVIKNPLSFPFAYTIKSDNENAKIERAGVIEPLGSRAFVFPSQSFKSSVNWFRYYIYLSHLDDDPRIHHPTVLSLDDENRQGWNDTCLRVTPVCRNVYNVTVTNSVLSHRYEFAWTSLQNNMTGVGSVQTGGTYRIFTGVGRADELLQVDLIDHRGLPHDRRKETVALGRRKDCNALI